MTKEALEVLRTWHCAGTWVLVCCPLHCMLLSRIQGGRGFPGPDVTQADLCTVGGVGTMHVAPVMCGAMTGMAATLDSTFKRAHVTAGHSRSCWCRRHPMASSGSPRRGCSVLAVPWWGVPFSPLGRIQETSCQGLRPNLSLGQRTGRKFCCPHPAEHPHSSARVPPQKHSGSPD